MDVPFKDDFVTVISGELGAVASIVTVDAVPTFDVLE